MSKKLQLSLARMMLAMLLVGLMLGAANLCLQMAHNAMDIPTTRSWHEAAILFFALSFAMPLAYVFRGWRGSAAASLALFVLWMVLCALVFEAHEWP